MDLLIDSHAWIWFVTDDPQLPDRAAFLIKDLQNKCFISITSLWEVAIKYSSGRIVLKKSLNAIIYRIGESNIEWLPISKCIF